MSEDKWIDDYHEPIRIPVDEEFVELGKWENPYGEIETVQGSWQVYVRYYGTCPCCRSRVQVACICGTYADPFYPNYCPECGAYNMREAGDEADEN